MNPVPPPKAPPTSHRAKPARALALAVMAVAAVAPMVGCSSKTTSNSASAAPTANVTLTPTQREHIQIFTVARAPFTKTVESSGVVDFDNDQATSVLAPFSGPVTRLLVSAGDKVKKGQPLAVVASSDFAAAVGAYSKALATARTNRRLADTDKDLLQHNGVSQREALQAETDAANAEADRDAALKGLAALGIDQETTKALQQGRPVSRFEGLIRSPIAGTVAERLITPGQFLQAGTTACFTVADLSRAWVMAQISDSDIASVKLGDRADILTSAAPAGLSGTVGNVSAVVNPDTRSVVARVVVGNPGDVLKKQMYVRVLIRSRQPSTGLLVPVSAILRDDENLPFVYLVQPDGGFARRPVTLGYRTGDQYEIAAGLKVGARIVVDGGVFIQFMQSQ